MSKFIANKVYKMVDEQNQTIICFVIKNENRYSAEFALKELKTLPEKSAISIEALQYKSKRSLEQNRMLWGLLEKLATAQSGYQRKEDVEDCYIQILEEANIKSKFFMCLPEDKKDLQDKYRVVKKVGERTVKESGQTLDMYQCWTGSSKFDTKQMSDLIEMLLDRLAELGITDSYIEAAWEEYKK